ERTRPKGAGAESEGSSDKRSEASADRRGARARARSATPAEELPPGDRDEAVRIVRGVRKLTLRTVELLVAALDQDGLDVQDVNRLLDRDAAQALLNLERTARDVLDSHPDLLKLVGDEAK